MLRAVFLTRIDQRQALLEEAERRPVHQSIFVGNEERRPRLVVILQKTELHEILGIDVFLPLDRLGIRRERALTREVSAELLIHVVVIAEIERLIDLAVGERRDPAPAHIGDEARLHALAQPDATRAHRLDLLARLEPEFQRDQRRYVTAEAVHDLSPHLQRVDLIIP